jgi:hypothetical protein
MKIFNDKTYKGSNNEWIGTEVGDLIPPRQKWILSDYAAVEFTEIVAMAAF